MSLSIGNIANSLQGMNMPAPANSGTTDQGASAAFNSTLKNLRYDSLPGEKFYGKYPFHARRPDHAGGCEKPVADGGDGGDTKTEMKELLAVLKELVTSISKMLEANTARTDAAAIEPAPEEPALMDPPADDTQAAPETMDPAGVDAASQMPLDPSMTGESIESDPAATSLFGTTQPQAATEAPGDYGDQMPLDPSMMGESIESDPTITPLFGSTQPQAATEVPGDNSAQMQQMLISLQSIVSRLSAMLANGDNGSAAGA